MLRVDAILKATEELKVEGSGVRYSDPEGKVYEITGDLTDAQIKEIEAKADAILTEWTTQAYARQRQAEYPDWGTQLNKIYDDGVTKWKSEMVDPIKAKWPKDNSGPK